MNLGHKTDSTDIALTVLYAHDRILEAGSLPASWLAVNPKLNFTGGDFFEPELWHSRCAASGHSARGGCAARSSGATTTSSNST